MKNTRHVDEEQGGHGDPLLADIDHFTAYLKEMIFRSDKERALDSAWRFACLVEKGTRMELTRDEWRELKDRLQDTHPATEDGVHVETRFIASFNDQQKTTDEHRKHREGIESRRQIEMRNTDTEAQRRGEEEKRKKYRHSDLERSEGEESHRSFAMAQDDEYGGEIESPITDNRSLIPDQPTTDHTSLHALLDSHPANLQPVIYSLLSDEISLVEHFYSLVEARDEVLIKNFERYRTENNQTKTILITGGFHAEKIKASLIEDNTSFISLVPRIEPTTDIQAVRGLYMNTLTSVNPHVATLALANAFESDRSVNDLFGAFYKTHISQIRDVPELDFKNMLVDALIAMDTIPEDTLNQIAQKIYALHATDATQAAQTLFEIDPQNWTIDIALDEHMNTRIYPIRDGLEGTMSIGATTRHEATHDWNDVRPTISELEKMVIAGDEDRIISIANGNLYFNDHFVVWKDGALFHRYGEPVAEREYTCFVVWKDGHVSAERLVFVEADIRAATHIGEDDPKTYAVYRAGETEELSEKIRLASYGQRLLSAGKTVPIAELSDEFDDLFHLFKFPQVHKDNNNGIWGPAIGAKFLYRNRPSEKTYTSKQYKKTKVARPLVRRLLQGESIRFNTKIYEREYGAGIVQKSLDASGYTQVDHVQNQGEYKWINTHTIEIKFFRYRMAHNLLGITQSGKVVSYVITGHKGKTPTGIGCTPEEAVEKFAQAWDTQDPTDHLREIFLVSNGMDSLRRENGRVMISGGRGAYDSATCAYVFQKKKNRHIETSNVYSKQTAIRKYLAQREVYDTHAQQWAAIDEDELLKSKIDLMLICGSNDKKRTPQAAAELYKKLTAGGSNTDMPIIISGKWGDHCGTAGQARTEGEEFLDAMVERGIDPAVITLEKEALNLGQNIQFARPMIIRALLQRNNADANILVIHNSSGQRRAGETFIEQFRWKDGDREQKQPFDAISDDGTKDIKISKVYSFAPYTHDPFTLPSDDLDNASETFMLGEIERLIKYQAPHGNFIGRVDMPDDVMAAYRALLLPLSQETKKQLIYSDIQRLSDLLNTEKHRGEQKLEGLQDIADIKKKYPNIKNNIYDRGIAYIPDTDGELIIVGDLHGDQESLAEILRETDFENRVKDGENVQLVFLGDYGHLYDVFPSGLETTLRVMQLKLDHPDNVTLAVGNQERDNHRESIDEAFFQKMLEYRKKRGWTLSSFYDELEYRFGKDEGKKLYDAFGEMFNLMPALVVCGNGVVATHGGPLARGKNVTDDTHPDLSAIIGNEKLQRELVNNFINDDLIARRQDSPSEDASVDISVAGQLYYPERGTYILGSERVDEMLNALGGDVLVRAHDHQGDEKMPWQIGNLVTVISCRKKDTIPRYVSFNKSKHHAAIRGTIAAISFDDPYSKDRHTVIREIEKAGTRDYDEFIVLIEEVEKILAAEKQDDALKRRINEINSSTYFTQAGVAYIPDKKGDLIVVGDLHGDYSALRRIMEKENITERLLNNEKMHLVFLGDISDMGGNTVECLQTVFVLKKYFPQKITILMGNHEQRQVTKREAELQVKAGEIEKDFFKPYEDDEFKIYHHDQAAIVRKSIEDLFNQGPFQAITANGIVLVHGTHPSNEMQDKFDIDRKGLLALQDDASIRKEMMWSFVSRDEELEDRPFKIKGSSHRWVAKKAFDRYMNSIGANIMVRGHDRNAPWDHTQFNDRFISIISTDYRSATRAYPKKDKIIGRYGKFDFAKNFEKIIPAEVIDPGIFIASDPAEQTVYIAHHGKEKSRVPSIASLLDPNGDDTPLIKSLHAEEALSAYLSVRRYYDVAKGEWVDIDPHDFASHPPAVDLFFFLGNPEDESTYGAAEVYKQLITNPENKDLPILISGKWPMHGINGATWSRDEMVRRGIDPEVFTLEEESLNTGENIRMSRTMIDSGAVSGIQAGGIKTIFAVNGPYQRRVGESLLKQYLTKEEHANGITLADLGIERIYDYTPWMPDLTTMDHDQRSQYMQIMCGEIDRLIMYPEKGFFDPVMIPPDVMESYVFVMRTVIDSVLNRLRDVDSKLYDEISTAYKKNAVHKYDEVRSFYADYIEQISHIFETQSDPFDIRNALLEYKYEKAAQKGYAMQPDDLNLSSVTRRFDPETNMPWSAEKNPFELAAWNLMPEEARDGRFLDDVADLQDELFRGIFDISRGSPDVYMMEREHFHIAPFPYYSFVDALDRAENRNARLADPVWSNPDSIEKAVAITRDFTAGLEAPTIRYKKVILTGDGTLVIVGIPSNDAIYRIRTDLINELRENGFTLSTPVEWVHSTIGRLLRKPTKEELRLLQERIKAINERFDMGEGLPVWQDVRQAFFSDNNNNVMLNRSPNEKWWTIGTLQEEAAAGARAEHSRAWPDDVKADIVSKIDQLATEIATSVRGSYVSLETAGDVVRFSIRRNGAEQDASLERYRIAVATHIMRECETYARAKGYAIELRAYPSGFDVVYKGSSAERDSLDARPRPEVVPSQDEVAVSRGVSELFRATAYPTPSRAFVGVYIEALSRRTVDIFRAVAESADRVVLFTESISAWDHALLDELLSIDQVTVRTPAAGILDPRIGWAKDFRMAVDELPLRGRRIVAPRHVLADLARQTDPERLRYLFMVGSSSEQQDQYSDDALIAILPFAFLPLDVLEAQTLVRKHVRPNGIPAYYELAFDRFISLDLISRLAQEISITVTDILTLRSFRQAA